MSILPENVVLSEELEKKIASAIEVLPRNVDDAAAKNETGEKLPKNMDDAPAAKNETGGSLKFIEAKVRNACFIFASEQVEVLPV